MPALPVASVLQSGIGNRESAIGESGHSFAVFGAEHFIAIAVVLGGSVALAMVGRARRAPIAGNREPIAGNGRPVAGNGRARLDRAIRWALAAGCVAFEVGEIGWHVGAGEKPLAASLPLHLCDISILIAPVVLLTANRYAFELLYFWGIGGTSQALLTPALLSGFPAPRCILFFLAHGLILASVLYGTLAMRLRPPLWSLLRVWIATSAYALLIIPVNVLLGTNYLYIITPPPTPSLLSLLGRSPWDLLAMEAVAFAVFFISYLPFLVADWRASRAS